MKIGDIYYSDLDNGEGIRTVLFVSGCKHKCKGCHNPDTWSFDFGRDFTLEDQNDIIEYCKQPYVHGIEIKGGELYAYRNV